MENLDVLIIGAAYYIQKDSTKTNFKIIEARDDLGGTWDLFRYPGIRSDSDLFTFAYEFNPWDGDNAIADGESIKAYIKATAKKFNIFDKIRFQSKVIEINWDTQQRLWRVLIEDTKTNEKSEIKAKWIFNATGYYRYDQGYSPEFKNQDEFKGQIVHPQSWPADLDYSDKEVIVIGSGATAITLIPAMSEKTKHITMLQRTPTYVMPIPSKDKLSKFLRPILGEKMAFKLTRKFHILQQKYIYELCQRFPETAKKLIQKTNQKLLPNDFPVDKHFNPPYGPWDQRLCAVPDGDLFKVITKGEASIVTDEIESFTPEGIRLKSGDELKADIIITATGLNLQLLGGIKPKIDGEVIDLSKCITYKGILLSHVPNFAFAIGYTASSWTLKIGLLCEYFSRLLNFMDENGYQECFPKPKPNMKTKPFLDFGAGYIQRSIDKLPKQGDQFPWSTSSNYAGDVKIFRKGRIDDPNLEFKK